MRKTKSKILGVVHETEKGLRAVGAIDQVTICPLKYGMRRYTLVRYCGKTSCARQV
jgi:hypothetical protein